MSGKSFRAPVRSYYLREDESVSRTCVWVSWIVLAAGAAAGMACTELTDPDDRPTVIVTDRLEYRPRPWTSVIVTTRTATADTIFDNHCDGGTEGFEYLGRWNGSYGAGRFCDRSQPTLGRDRIPIPPGTVHVDTFFVHETQYTGTWRVQLHLHDYTGALLPIEERISNTFHVEGTWTP